MYSLLPTSKMRKSIQVGEHGLKFLNSLKTEVAPRSLERREFASPQTLQTVLVFLVLKWQSPEYWCNTVNRLLK